MLLVDLGPMSLTGECMNMIFGNPFWVDWTLYFNATYIW